MRSRARQLPLQFSRRGGARPGAGRKPKEGAGVPHRPRLELKSRHPVHVTLRVAQEVWNLRSRRCFREIARAFRAVHGSSDFRIIEFSVQGNHVHLIVEARDKEALSRGLRRIEIRMAKRLNKLMGRRSGQVFPDRYHAHILRTPTEVAHALSYVRGNFAIHAARRGDVARLASVDRFSSAALVNGAWPEEAGPPLVAAPRTWLLVEGWRKARPKQHGQN
jgi:REP element-mobilizing transposase RayT